MNDTHVPSTLRERLRVCEAQRHACFDDAPVAMALVSLDGQWLRVNDVLARRLGSDSDALAGKPMAEAFHPEDRATVSRFLSQLRADHGTRVDCDLRLAGVSGAFAWVSARAVVPVVEQAGSSSWIFFDQVERRADDDRARYLAAIVDASDDAIIGKTLDGIVTSWNRGAETIYGYSAEEMIGRPLNVVAPPDLKDEIPAILARIRAGEPVVHYETRRRRKDGASVHLSLTVSPVYDRDGKLIGASTVGRDMSRRLATEQQLRATADLLEKVFSSVHVLLAYLDRDFNFVKVNHAYAAENGHPPEFFRGKNLFALRPDAQNEAVFRRAVATGKADFKSEREVQLPNRGVTYWDQVVQPVTGVTGEVEGVVLSLLDVTEKARATRRAEQAAAYARLLIEANPDPLITIRADGVLTDANAAFLEATGRTREQVVGSHHSTFVTEPKMALAAFAKTTTEGLARDLPLELRHVDGHTTPVIANASAFRDETGQVVGVLAVARDVTALRRAQAEAEKSAAYARLLVEANLDPLVTITVDGYLTDANAAFLEATGRTREEVVGSFYTMHVTPVETAEAAFGKAVVEGQVRDVALELKHVAGHTTSVLYNANIFRDETGQVVGVLAVARDISSLKRAEAEVGRLNRWNKLLLDSAGEGIYGIDTDGRCTFANPALTRLLGYDSPDELMGKNAHALFHHSRSDGRPYPVEECPAHRAYVTATASRGADEVYWRKDGSPIAVEFVSTPIREGDQVVGAVVTVVDITLRKRAEALLRLRAKEQEGIARLGLRALSGESLDALMSDATHLVAESLEVEFCKVLELLPGGKEVLLRAGVGWKDGCVGQAKVGAGRDSQAGYTLESKEPVVVKDLRKETRFSGPPLLHEHGVVSGMSVVIPGREGPFGVMGAHTTREREFSRDDANFLQAVANVIAASVERAHAEERLRAASAYNRRLIEAGLDPLVTIGPDGTITDVNAATEAVTGRPRDALVGTDFSTYFVDPGKARAGYEQVFREGYVRDYPLELTHVDGHVTPVLYNATVYRDEQGRVAGVFAAARDVTERQRAEEAVRASEARLSKAQEIAHIGSWELELVSGRLLWSDEIYRIFEIDKTKFGASYEAFLEAIHPEDRGAVDFAYSNSVKTRVPYSIDHRLLFPDGRIKHVHEQCETVYDESGVPLRSLGTVQDITDRKRAEEAMRMSETRYRSLFERMFDGYAVHEILLDEGGRPCDYVFLEVNPAFERMTGLRRADLVGRRVTEVLPQTERHWIGTYGEVALTGRGRRFEQYARAFDRYFEVAAFSPGPRQFATLFSDVTERRRAEQALRDLNNELERRVRDRTAELEAANRELESFSYSVSHDLRTPLRAVDGFSRILLSEYETKLDEEGRRLLHVVRENTERMAQLISDILNFSRTGRAEMKRERIAMRSLVEEAWAEAVQDQGGRRIELRMSALPDASGDRALLRQVVANLISNAIKFTRPRSLAIVEVGAEEKASEIVYHVKDNGVGFDMGYVEKLFGVFQRLHSPEEFEGTGIGLAIVKRIVARHGGRVWAESGPEEGARFYFALPREEPWTDK